MTRRNYNRFTNQDKFYIITNGAQTECNYFKLLKSKKSIYDVKIKFENADPLGLVKYAISIYNNHDANQIWCVFDIDYTHQERRLVPAIKLAEQNGIRYAYSNKSFEVWLISHFIKCDKELDINDHKKILDDYLKKIDSHLEYEKTNEELLKKHFIGKYKIAVENAKAVHQNFIKQHRETYGLNSNYRIWEWNSSTTVYKLVEALKLEK